MPIDVTTSQILAGWKQKQTANGCKINDSSGDY